MRILREPVLLLLACGLLAWGVYAASQGAEVRSADAHDSLFSAKRAEVLLRNLYRDTSVHVSGSPQNAAQRDRVVGMLEHFGYQPELQSQFHCRTEIGRCSPVDNIIAVRKGREPGGAILLTAHYDGSWAGPGVADDGAGVAALLEVARMAAVQPDFNHDLIFLFTDAEEQGLIGADAFARTHPLFPQIRTVINLEARGSSGASVMFETGTGNRRIIRLLAQSLGRPVANSVAYEVYRRMPNDTDFSIYKDYGLAGVNFAFTGGASIYHSEIDDLDHLDLRSLQHHGQNAWSMLLAMDERNLENMTAEEDAAYIDLFGKKLLHYPVSSATGLALVLSVLVLAIIRRAYARQFSFRQVIWTVVSIGLLFLAMPLFGWLLSWPLGRWVEMSSLQHPFPWLGRATLLLSGVWVLAWVLRFLAPRASVGSVTLACWLVFSGLGLLLAYQLPIAGYLAVLPLLGFCLGALLDGARWRETPKLVFASLFGFLAAAYLGLYFFFQLDVILDFSHSHYKMIPLLLPALAALPLVVWYFEGRVQSYGLSIATFILILAACFGQTFVPAFTSEVPRDMSVVYIQNSGDDAPVLKLESALGAPVDMQFALLQGFAPRPVKGSEVQGDKTEMVRPTELLDLPDVVELRRSVQDTDPGGEGRKYTVDLQVPVGVRQLSLQFPAKAILRRVMWSGKTAYEPESGLESRRRANTVVINHPSAGENRLEFEISENGPVTVNLKARFDLPIEVLRPMQDDWPKNARPAFGGHRAVKMSDLNLP